MINNQYKYKTLKHVHGQQLYEVRRLLQAYNSTNIHKKFIKINGEP